MNIGLVLLNFPSQSVTVVVPQYETVVDSESLGTLQPVAYHTVNRRYSDFLHLQTRLEEKPDLKKMIKSKKSNSIKKM